MEMLGKFAEVWFNFAVNLAKIVYQYPEGIYGKLLWIL